MKRFILVLMAAMVVVCTVGSCKKLPTEGTLTVKIIGDFDHEKAFAVYPYSDIEAIYPIIDGQVSPTTKSASVSLLPGNYIVYCHNTDWIRRGVQVKPGQEVVLEFKQR